MVTEARLKQKDIILEWLESGNSLTRLTAWEELGILEAPARISELRKEGHEIETDKVQVSNRHGHTVTVARWKLS